MSTNAILQFSVRNRGHSRVSDFFEDVEESLSKRSGECVRILSAAVGSFPVNIRERTKSVRYFMLDCEPWCIQTVVYFSDSTAVRIKEVSVEGSNESTVTVMCSKKDTMKDIKLKVAKMTCRRVSSIRLVLGKKELPEIFSLANWPPAMEKILLCIYRDFKIGFCAPYIYIPIQGHNHESKRLARIGSDIELPVWRRATPGMWLEGICKNEICLAYMKMVIMNLGFIDLNFVTETSGICPICYGRVSAVTAGFSCCNWMTVGEKVQLSEEQDFPQIVRENWKTVPKDHYFSISPNILAWSCLKIISRKLDYVHFCVICMEDILQDTYTAQCGHVFHMGCFYRTGNDVCVCCLCVSRQVMTDYQQLFNC